MINKLYGFVLISLSLAILSQPLDARLLSQLPKFEKWVGSQPDQEILSMTLFEHPIFRQGIEQLIPLQQWNELWETYVFAQPVGQMDHWLVVSGHLKNNPGDTDLSIFLDTTTQQVAGVCLASYSRVYPYYPDAHEADGEERPLHISLVEVKYYIPAGQLVFKATDQFADCGRGNPEKAIKQWQALQILLGK